MSATAAIALALLLPLTGAGTSALFHRSPNLRETFSLLAGGGLLAITWSLLPRVEAGERPALELFEMLPGLAIAFEVEPLGMLFALVAAMLWIVTTVYSIGYLRGNNEDHQSRFFACFAVAIFAAVGAAMAGNMLTLFVFYEVLTLSTYPLVTHHGTAEARRGGRVYLGVLLFTSITFLLLAVVWTWFAAGTLDFQPGGILAGKASTPVLAVLLALYAFGTGKAALMPFHRWLPAAMVAPTPVSALLHAVAVVKVGVFTVLKVVVYIFGLDLLRDTDISLWIAWAAGFTVLAASLVAMTKENLKARLAYSTVSQLSYIVLGAMLANAWGVIGGGMHIAMHAFGKITLFFCAGAIYVATHKKEIPDLSGLGRVMPWTFAAFVVGAFSVIGVPPLGGSWSKWFLALGAVEAEQQILVAVLMISSLLNILYLMPIPVRAFFSPLSAADTKAFPERKEPWLCVAPPVVTALGCVALFFVADDIYQLLMPIAGGSP
ncbi:MAG: monovalent cation/H+ antiporter subunit D family protein [Acidobacteriota bacterium]